MKKLLLKRTIVLFMLTTVFCLFLHAQDKIVTVPGVASYTGTYVKQSGTWNGYSYYYYAAQGRYLYVDDGYGVWVLSNQLIHYSGDYGYIIYYQWATSNPATNPGDPTWYDPYNGNGTIAIVIQDATTGTAPSATTDDASLVTTTSGTMNGNIIADGGATTSRGFVYSSSDNTPTIGEGGVTQVTNGTGTGTYSSLVSSLTPGAIYYYQAYGINSYGTTYGGVKSFTTPTTSQPNKYVSGITNPSSANGIYVWIGNYYGKPAWKHQSQNYYVYYSRYGVSFPSTYYWYIDDELKGEHGANDYNFYHADAASCPSSGWTIYGASTGTVSIIDYPNISFTNGAAYSPANPTGGTSNNPIGRFLLSGELAGASLTAATITLSGTRTGVSNIKIWSSTDATFNSGSDTQLNSQSDGTSVTFSGFSSSISTSGTYYFITADLGPTANGSLAPVIASTANLTISGGAIASGFTNAALTGATLNIIPVVNISVNDVSVNENAGNTVFTISLSQTYSSNITINYATANNTATTGDNDYTSTSGTATITAGQLSTTVTVPVTNDNYYESNETFYLNLSGNSYGTITDAQGIGTITNEDSQPSVTLGLTASPLAENGGVATVTAILSNRSYQNVTVNLGYTGTATGTTDYTAASSITINAGALSNTTTITGVDDALDDDNETVVVDITSVTNGTETGTQQVTATIADDDDSPTVFSVGSTTANGAYKTGDVIAITVTFSKAVTVTGTPTLTLNSGGIASYALGSGSSVLTFNYTIAAGQSSADLDYSSTNSLSLAGGTIKDAGTNAANLTLPTAGGASSLGGQKNIVVDGIAPTVTLSSTASAPTNVSPIPVTITFSESVIGFDASDITVTNGTKGTLSGSGASYSINITPSGQGAVTVNIAAGMATDAAGNSNTAATQLSRTFDNVNPSVGLISSAGNPTSYTVLTVDINFTEVVTGFDASDITVTNGTKGSLSGSGASYAIIIYPSAQGTVTVNVAAGVATDAAGNSNTSGMLSFTFDNLAPYADITSTTTTSTNVSPIPVTFAFSEPVTGFDVSDITVTNGTKGSLSGGGNSYSINITPSAQGVVTVNIATGAATDAAGNSSLAAVQLSRTYDNVAPTVTLSSTAGNPTNASTIPVTITFSESVTGFDASDIAITNGTKGTLSGSGASYSIDITPSGQGAVTVNVGAGVATDAAGNANSAATQLSRTFDNVVPTVAITSTANSTTNVSPLPVTVTFSEAVTGFVVGDIAITNGTASGFSGSGTTYTLNVTPSGLGTVTVNVAAGVATDAAGNSNTAATQLSRTFDNASPFAGISALVSDPTNVSPIPVYINFSESVTGFNASDITVTNATKGTFTQNTGESYILEVIPSGQGVVTVNVAAGVATDAAGNSNTAATQYSCTFDNIAPTVILTSSAGEPTKTSPIPMTITFSESVTGFDASDITVTNGTKGTLSGSGASYSINITPSGQGAVTVNIAAGLVTDAAGNANTAATQLSRTFDNVSPSVTLASSASETTNVSPIPVTIAFSESVIGFDASDITVTNGTKGTVSGSGASYSINITPSGQGAVTVAIAAGIATDAAGNSNTAATSLTRTYNTVSPLVTLTSTTSSSTNASQIPVIITFSEAVTGFDASDITVTNGTKGTLSGSGASYEIDITPLAPGTVTVGVAAGVATSLGGNANVAATSLTRTYDIQGPSVALSSTTSEPTNASPIPVTITFSEPVTGFDAGDITVTNGTKGTLSGSGASYTINITPSAQGTVTVDVASGVATDAAGNNNYSATQLSRAYDNQAPSVDVTSTVLDPTHLITIPIDIVFSEAVTGFTLSDIITYAGTASDLQTTDNIHWTANVTFTSHMGAKSVDIAAGSVQDLAGNGNTAAPYFQRTYDPKPPTVTISSTSSNPTKDNPIVVKMKFSETVVNFKASNIVVTNGTASNLQTDYYQEEWTADIYPTADGDVTVDLPLGAAQDYAGNNSTAATQFKITSDRTSPTVVMSSTSTGSTKDSPITVNIVFSEPVSGSDDADITVTNGTIVSMGGGGNAYTIDIVPSAQGLVTVDIGANVAQDAAGNGNTAATQFSRIYDTQAPSVTLSSTTASLTNVSPIPVTITFSEPVTGFDAGDITVTNGTWEGFSGSGDTYTVNITPSGQGQVSVNVAAGVTADAAGNTNTASLTLSRTFDNVPPSVSITSTTSEPTNSSTIPVTITFSETVTGFDVDDITVVNGSKGTMSGSGTTYTLTITPSAQGMVSVFIPTGVTTDAAGNSNNASNPFSRIFDSASPSVSITSMETNPTNTSPFYVTITFSEAVSGFDITDISVSNGTKGTLSGSGSSYSLKVVPSAPGVITVNVDAGIAVDAAGNTNLAATPFQITYTTDYLITGNAGVAGVTLSYTNGSVMSVVTNNTGDYIISVPVAWNGTITPEKAGYTFSPASRDYLKILSNQTAQNFTATVVTYTISGNAGVGGAILSYTDGTAKTATAGNDGAYSFTVSWNWSGTVSVTKAGYTFSADKVYSNVVSNKTSQDYTATAITYTISGNAGVGGATLSYTDGTAKTATAGNDGAYSFTVSYNWSGTVTPSKTNYTFNPANIQFTNVLSDKTAQNFAATNTTGIKIVNSTIAEATIYPTVNQGSFNIDMTGAGQGKVTVKIMSTSGSVVKEFQFTKSLKDQTFHVNMDRATVGLYLVEIAMGDYRNIHRMLIQ